MNWSYISNTETNPKMSDGRDYSKLLPNEIIHDNVKKEAGIVSNWDYRRYLQTNASHIIKHNTSVAVSATGLVEDPNNHVPMNFFGYRDKDSHSDLKKQYLTKEQMIVRQISPSINLEPNK